MLTSSFSCGLFGNSVRLWPFIGIKEQKNLTASTYSKRNLTGFCQLTKLFSGRIASLLLVDAFQLVQPLCLCTVLSHRTYLVCFFEEAAFIVSFVKFSHCFFFFFLYFIMYWTGFNICLNYDLCQCFCRLWLINLRGLMISWSLTRKKEKKCLFCFIRVCGFVQSSGFYSLIFAFFSCE